MAGLRSHPLQGFEELWSVGDDWPEPPTVPDVAIHRNRRAALRAEPPLLSLTLGGLFSVPLIPRPPAAGNPPATHAPLLPAAAAAAIAAANPDGALCNAAAGGITQQLQALLGQREPRLAARLAATGESADASFFARWLKARGGSAEAAAEAILSHLAWRETFVCGGGSGSGDSGSGAAGGGPSGVAEESIAAELAARKVFLQGCDSHGCPVVVVKAARHDMSHRDLQQTKRLIVYVLDNACATAAAHLECNPAGQICCLFDLSGLRPRNLDVKVLAAIFELLQQHYPERLNSLYFLNAPLIFWGIWRLVSPFVHANTRQKLRFIGGAAGRRQLLERVPAEVLPAEYGGSAELAPIDEAVSAWRQQQAAAATAATAAAAISLATVAGSSSTPGSGGGGGRAAAAAALRRAGSAATATKHFLHHKIARPVGGAAAGAARALQQQHHQLLLRSRRRQGGKAGDGRQQHQQQLLLTEQPLLAKVVLAHVLLVGLLLRMLQRMLGRRPADAAAGSISASGKDGSGEQRANPPHAAANADHSAASAAAEQSSGISRQAAVAAWLEASERSSSWCGGGTSSTPLPRAKAGLAAAAAAEPAGPKSDSYQVLHGGLPVARLLKQHQA